MATQLKNIKISTAQDRDGSGISDTSTVENRPVDKPYGWLIDKKNTKHPVVKINLKTLPFGLKGGEKTPCYTWINPKGKKLHAFMNVREDTWYSLRSYLTLGISTIFFLIVIVMSIIVATESIVYDTRHSPLGFISPLVGIPGVWLVLIIPLIFIVSIALWLCFNFVANRIVFKLYERNSTINSK